MTTTDTYSIVTAATVLIHDRDNGHLAELTLEW